MRGDRLSIEMRLYDATQGTLLVGKRYTGTPGSQLRSIVHRFANEIVYAFTGCPGRLRDRDRLHRPLGEVQGEGDSTSWGWTARTCAR